jgi:hypothetical protein
MAEQIAHEASRWVALDLACQLEAEAEATERGEARPSAANNG